MKPYSDEIENVLSQDSEKADQNAREVQQETPPRKPVKSILLVDDEEQIRSLFKEALERFGYAVRVASNGEEGLAMFTAKPTDLIITDVIMPEKDGHAFIFEVRQAFPEVKVFAITGNIFFGKDMELDIAKTLGATNVFTKPIKIHELLEAIHEL